MADFQEVVRQLIRLCEKQIDCDTCPIDKIGCCGNVGALRQARMIEENVMLWAAEHPEPVYPTWSEWLVEIGVFPKMMSTIPSKALDAISNGVCKPIPADIAEKLGIEPKEGT